MAALGREKPTRWASGLSSSPARSSEALPAQPVMPARGFSQQLRTYIWSSMFCVGLRSCASPSRAHSLSFSLRPPRPAGITTQSHETPNSAWAGVTREGGAHTTWLLAAKYTLASRVLGRYMAPHGLLQWLPRWLPAHGTAPHPPGPACLCECGVAASCSFEQVLTSSPWAVRSRSFIMRQHAAVTASPRSGQPSQPGPWPCSRPSACPLPPPLAQAHAT